MWRPADYKALPAHEGIAGGKSAIKSAESRPEVGRLVLAEAQLEVTTLETYLAETRTWKSPIWRLTSDELSLIFEFCGEDDWRTPLRGAAVSTFWRNVALSTPRAWSYLDLKWCDDHVRQSLFTLFCQRSGQRPLHVFVPDDNEVDLLSGLEHRIKCLSVDTALVTEGKVFPNLETLTIRFEGSSIELPDISKQFPALRSLICSADLELFEPEPDSSSSRSVMTWPLEVLSLSLSAGTSWLTLLQGCESTLVELRIEVFTGSESIESVIILPRLKSLEIRSVLEEHNVFPLTLETPILEAYAEHREGPRAYQLLHKDVGTVTHAYLDRVSGEILAGFTSLCVLQLDSYLAMGSLLHELHTNEGQYPTLSRVELAQSIPKSPPFVAQLEEINKKRQVPIELVGKSSFDYNRANFLDRIKCGAKMPCNYYGS